MTFSLSTPFGLTLPVFSQEQVSQWFKNARKKIVGGPAGKATKTKNKKTKQEDSSDMFFTLRYVGIADSSTPLIDPYVT